MSIIQASAHWRPHLWATHCRLDYYSFITAWPCAFRLWQMYSAAPDLHAILPTALKARRRTVSDSLVLLMSGAQSKQGHRCRASQDKEKSQLGNIVKTSFSSLFLTQKSQLAGQIITLQQTGFLNKYPQCTSLILNSLAVCLWCIPAP